MATPRPGKGKPFAPGLYSHAGHSLVLAQDGAIRVKPGDTISKYAACLNRDALAGWEEFGRVHANAVKPIPNGFIHANETIYHIPTWKANNKAGAAGPAIPEASLAFDGKKLTWNLQDGTVLRSMPAVSGLRKNNKFIAKLIASGRKDIKTGVDYTDSKYQNLTSAGPIPEGEFYLPLKPAMPFEKTGGGWGAGGWQIHNVGYTGQILSWLDAKLAKEEID